MRLFIISNRLPLKAQRVGKEFRFSRSEGGLATGLDSLEMSVEKYWIGWPGLYTENEGEKENIRLYLEKFHFSRYSFLPDRYTIIMRDIAIAPYGRSVITFFPMCNTIVVSGRLTGK